MAQTHWHWPQDSAPIGLVAGWGRFPVQVAQHVRDHGQRLVVAAIKSHADDQLRNLANDHRVFGVAKLGGQIQYFKRHGVRQVVLAGKLFKDRILLHGLGWIGHLPDVTCLRALYHSFISGRADQRDDTILRAIVSAFEANGMTVLSSDQVAPDLMAQPGLLTTRSPSKHQLRDIHFGWSIAKTMGQLDIGQSIVVLNQTVLGVEAIEGTDALIARIGQLCPRGGFTLVKVAKPQQDMRFDVPTIGLRTVEQLHKAGGRAIAIEAGRTIVVDRQATLHRANQLGIAIIALENL